MEQQNLYNEGKYLNTALKYSTWINSTFIYLFISWLFPDGGQGIPIAPLTNLPDPMSHFFIEISVLFHER